MTITVPQPLDPDRVAHARGRLRILYALDLTEQLCVGDLALALGANVDQFTYAPRLLRTAGLVVSRRQGRTVYNRLADDFPDPLREHRMRQLTDITRHVAADAEQ